MNPNYEMPIIKPEASLNTNTMNENGLVQPVYYPSMSPRHGNALLP